MSRADISDKLVHFTGPRDNWAEAYSRLKSILAERTIRGGKRMIRSGDHCVCFTEVPLESLPGGLVNPINFSRYAPFGLVFAKTWIFDRGGRPAIYEPESEFRELPDSHKWRHVRYEPTAAQPIDFTWEREWRIKADALQFQPNDVVILVPMQESWDVLRREHEDEQDWWAYMYSEVLDREILEQYREDFPWRVSVLGVRPEITDNTE
jgi:hypothetical protein